MSLFSNGTEYQCFRALFCDRCARCKLDTEGMPQKDNCELEEKLALALPLPEDMKAALVPTGYQSAQLCLRFTTEDASVRQSYIETVRGFELPPTQWDMFVSLNPDAAYGQQETIQEVMDDASK